MLLVKPVVRTHSVGCWPTALVVTPSSLLSSHSAVASSAVDDKFDDRWFLAPVRSALPRTHESHPGFVLVEGAILAVLWSINGELWRLAGPLAEAMSQWIEPGTLQRALCNSTTVGMYLSLARVSARVCPSVMRAPVASALGANFPRISFRFCSPVLGLFWASLTGVAVVIVLQDLGVMGSHELVEEPEFVEASMDDQRSRGDVVIVAPLTEEIFFRGLLFARCVRFLGLAPALLVNGVLFGLLHRSDTSDKVWAIGFSGAVWALLYAGTRSFIAPIAVHMMNNHIAMSSRQQWSPMVRTRTHTRASPRHFCSHSHALWSKCKLRSCVVVFLLQLPLDSVSSTLSDEFQNNVTADAQRSHWKSLRRQALVDLGLFASLNDSSAQLAPEITKSDANTTHDWLPPDSRVLQPAVTRLINDLFHTLDRGHKGYLSADELAWLCTLRPDTFVLMNSAMNIIAKRVGGDAAHTQLVQTNMTRMAEPDEASLLELPSKDFLSAEQQEAGVARIKETLADFDHAQSHALQTLLSSTNTTIRVISVQSDDKVIALEDQLIRRYYTTYWRAFHRVYFPIIPTVAASNDNAESPSLALDTVGSCTLPRFQELIAREFLLRPKHSAAWISVALGCVSNLQNRHHVEVLMDVRTKNQESWKRSTPNTANKTASA